MHVRIAALTTAAVLLVGCASLEPEPGHVAVAAAPAPANEPSGVRERAEPFLALRPAPARPSNGPVSLAASEASFSALMTEVAQQHGYAIAFADGVDTSRRVSVQMRDTTVTDALRQLAFLAGYAAVIDEGARTVYVALNAAYTFRLPAVLFADSAFQYTTEGTSMSADKPTAAVQALVSGRDFGSGARLLDTIRGVAGPHAEVSATENGIVVVRANAQALRRTHEFLKRLTADALSEVDLEAVVLESRPDGAVPAAGSSVTAEPVQAVVERLRRDAQARVLAAPRISLLNRQPATLSTTAAGAHAAFSVIPFVMDARTAQLRFVPSISAGDSAGRSATAALLTVHAEAGRTTVIRGLRVPEAGAHAREYVIVLRANAVHVRRYDPLVGESL